jgi:hypothetical protein
VPEAGLSKRQVEGRVHDVLGTVLQPEGFVLKRSEERWVRMFPAGSQNVSIAIYDYDPDFEFEPTFGVRVDDVEAIRHKFSGSDVANQSLTDTIRSSSECVLGVDSFSASSVADVDEIAQQIAALIQEKALPYFDRYRDVEALHRSLNVERVSEFNIASAGASARTSLILARLAASSDFEALVAEKMPTDATYQNPSARPLSELVEYLRSIRLP